MAQIPPVSFVAIAERMKVKSHGGRGAWGVYATGARLGDKELGETQVHLARRREHAEGVAEFLSKNLFVLQHLIWEQCTTKYIKCETCPKILTLYSDGEDDGLVVGKKAFCLPCIDKSFPEYRHLVASTEAPQNMCRMCGDKPAAPDGFCSNECKEVY